jgi:hypothetical protein
MTRGQWMVLSHIYKRYTVLAHAELETIMERNC